MKFNQDSFRTFIFGLIFSLLALVDSPAQFPSAGIMPRTETGALAFLEEHPEYDGRGVVVAIFDSGVDPGARGLQTTTTGGPKIIDIIDASGSGDVDTSTVVKTEDGVLTGLTGRTLTPDPEWSNPTGEYHLGMKRAFELFPAGLIQRLKAKYREDFEIKNRAAINEAQMALQNFDRETPNPNKEQALTRRDLLDRIEVLRELMEEFDPPGPVFDCVVFHDGSTWRAVIDTDEDGDLSEEDLLTNYRDERKYSTFGREDLMNFSVNIYEDGNVLSIVTDSHPHGTHVAGIVAGHFPGQPELNGVAPGAQIVSVKIGDTRLDGMESTSAIMRGLIRVLEDEVDIINMSYGEPTTQPNDGRLNRFISEVVNEHGVIFVSSAGNAGPALSSVGSPGGTTSAIFGVGAYVSQEMMGVQYNLRENTPDNLYTWSSRGPTFDGDLGVNFVAPGGAFAPVPTWTLQGEMQMNGTSMSSPNASGNIALILSGLKQRSIHYTPGWILCGIEAIAKKFDDMDAFSQGRGLLQAGDAFDYLLSASDEKFRDVRYEISVSGQPARRGIYLREAFETGREFNARVSVVPRFQKDVANDRKVAFEKRVRLEPTAPWVSHSSGILMFAGDNVPIEVNVAAQTLGPGAHFAEVLGFDSEREDLGPLFRIPVTVIRPGTSETPGPSSWKEEVHLHPGSVERRFLTVPEGATWADLTVRNLQDEGERRFVVHALQRIPGNNYRHNEFRSFPTLKAGEQTALSFAVAGGRAMELDLGQYWSSPGEGALEADLHFHGVVPASQNIFIDGGDSWTRIDIASPLNEEPIQPSGSLTALRKTFRPTGSEITSRTGDRDRLPDERQIHQIILTYAFDAAEAGNVTPRFPALNDRLYELELGSQVWMLFDANKRLLKTDDTWPDAAHLEKGRHTLRLHLRHENLSVLEKVKDLPLQLDFSLSSPLRLSFHSGPDEALLSEGAFSRRTISPGDRLPVWIAVDSSSAPSSANAGDLLVGSVRFAASDSNRLGSADRPGGFPVTYRIAPRPVTRNDNSSGNADGEMDATEKLREQIRDLKVGTLAGLYRDEAAFNQIADDVLSEWPDHLPVLVEKLKRLDGDDRKEHLDAVIAAADDIIKAIDTNSIAVALGVRASDDDAELKARKEAEEQRDTLADTLYRKCRALAYRDAMNEEQTPGFEETFAELKKWADTKDDQYLLVHIRNERRSGRSGTAIKLLNGYIERQPKEEKHYEKRIGIFETLGWQHWADYDRQWDLIRFPGAYPLF